MSEISFGPKEKEQIKNHGLTESEVQRQVRIFQKGAPYADIDRPCRAGDGIVRLSPGDIETYAKAMENQGGRRRLTKFVPASGAATRMFKALMKVSGEHERIEKGELSRLTAEKGGEYQEVLEFVDNIEKFAFYGTLLEKMKSDGHDVEALRGKGDYTPFVEYVLGPAGLDYSNRPKGQILFHRYPDGPRTAFEEHLVEAAEYAKDARGDCFLHFTVSPEHEDGFARLADTKGPLYERAYGVRYDIGFSRQHPSTDTIAVDMDNRPFRDKDGSLVFRPGGHGALIGNLDRLGADIVFMKNIDNVVPDALKPDTILWKKVLAGYLLSLEQEIRLQKSRIAQADAGENVMEEVASFVEERLGAAIPEAIKRGGTPEIHRYLADRLDRPLRVCGMVPSSGEPGGGPFWVKMPDGTLSVQIVENAQIDPESPSQQEMLRNLTHFNPVDIVCSLRNEENEPYDLRRFVDESAVFISHKSKDGRDLKALEHPGLWNGAMAYWNSVFVEVPLSTFNPVKTVNDLLRDTHQA